MHRVDTRVSAVIVAAMALGGGFARAQQTPAAPNATAAAAIPAAVQVHIDHVMTAWKDTPGGIGLLPAAIDDAKIAEEHAHNTDLEGRVNDFILYSGYVLNALNPGAETQALLKTAYARLVVTDPKLKDAIPGSGYGVKKAVAGALQHVQLAAKAEGASENVKTHAMHVATSLENVVKWTDQSIALAQKILMVKTAPEGQPLVTELENLAVRITGGVDANSDGRIGWEAGEGGLEQAEMHMQLMMKGAPASSSTSSKGSEVVVAEKPSPQQISPDRIVAEWMLRMGGAVVLEGQRAQITDLADLPAADFTIHTLNFTGITMYAASMQDELRRLPPLPHLKELYVNGRLWYDQPAPRVAATMSLFSESPELEKLILSKPVQTYIPLNDSVVDGLASLKNLKQLRVSQTRLPGLSLSKFPLTHLDMNYVVMFNDDGMAGLKGMTTLSKLYLRGTSVTDDGLKNLANLTNLTELDLSDDKITDEGMAALAKLTKLRRLNLQGADITDAGLDVVKNMPELEELSLYRTKVSNAGLTKLATLKNLRSVDLRYSLATGSGVHELATHLPNTEILSQDTGGREVIRKVQAASVMNSGEAAIAEWLKSIGGKVEMTNGHVTSVSMKSTSITDREMAILTKLPQLTALDLQHTEISSDGLSSLSSITSLQSLDIGHTLLGDNSLTSLSPLVNLRSLHLTSTLVQGPGLAAISALTNLRELNLDGAPLGNEGMEHVAKIYGLETLSLRYTNLTDPAMEQIGKLKNLRRLDLSSVDVTEKGLMSLVGMNNLVDLDLSFARFAEPGLQVLVALPQLKRLGLEQTSVTDKAMVWVAALPKLEALNLNYTTVGDAGFLKLSGITTLTELKLDRTDIGDASLQVLSAQKNLKYADLYHTLISAQGHTTLTKALPRCEINYSLDAIRSRRRT
jgi:Leucine-rich repeat (LRR) protein